MLETDIHANQQVYGRRPTEAFPHIVIMLHGRGSSASRMESIRTSLFGGENYPFIAPQAAGGTWYPHSFLAPIESNQPYLDSALRRVESLVVDLIENGTPSERIALLGFSQGACLATEFAVRHPRHYGAILGLSGGLIGPIGTLRNYPGSLAETPVFLGSSDPDPHVPFARVEETAAVYTRMGATVDIRRYPGMAHMINADEYDACREFLRKIG